MKILHTEVPKGGKYATYEAGKRKLKKMKLSPKAYERKVKTLAGNLEL